MQGRRFGNYDHRTREGGDFSHKFVVTTGSADKEPSLVKLKEVNGLGSGQLVTVMVKVMDVRAPEKVKTKEGKDLYKQERKICDDS